MERNKGHMMLCCILAMSIIMFESCVHSSRTQSSDAIILDLKSGDGIKRSIEQICKPQLWTQNRFDSINTAINTLASAGVLNRNINEDKKHLANLFTSSAYCLERKVDSVFQLPVYSGYDKMKDDLAFLKKYLTIYLNAGVVIDDINPSLSKVEDIFDEYDTRLKKSKYYFSQKVVFLKDYSMSYKETEREIKNNEKDYWNKYFSKNKEIVNNVNAFPNRLKASRKEYYKALEDTIESVTIKKHYTLEDFLKVQTEFVKMAEDYNQDAIKKLEAFRQKQFDENINQGTDGGLN